LFLTIIVGGLIPWLDWALPCNFVFQQFVGELVNIVCFLFCHSCASQKEHFVNISFILACQKKFNMVLNQCS